MADTFDDTVFGQSVIDRRTMSDESVNGTTEMSGDSLSGDSLSGDNACDDDEAKSILWVKWSVLILISLQVWGWVVDTSV